MKDIIFISEDASAADVLQLFLKTHEQLAVVVDEFGATAGVVTMEDVVEHLIGCEIFEKDDIAVDMRELAKNKAAKKQTFVPPPSQGEVLIPNIDDKNQ
mgnify:CR=1 FL=1